MIDAFEAALATLVGLPCWGTIAGTGSGSMFTIELGGRVRRDASVKNDNISEDLRLFCGEYCIFVEGCAWRLEQDKAIICAWGEEERTIRENLRVLENRTLTKVEITNWALDLKISFDQRFVLRLFCDQTAGTLDNYSVRFPSAWYSVQPNSALQRQLITVDQ